MQYVQTSVPTVYEIRPLKNIYTHTDIQYIDAVYCKNNLQAKFLLAKKS